MYLIGVGAGMVLFFFLQFASPEEAIRQRRRRAGKLDAAELDEMEEEELEERMRRTPRILNAPEPQPPLSPWTGQMPAPPQYGPWSTSSQQRPPQINGRG
jgi:hypothetical protein